MTVVELMLFFFSFSNNVLLLLSCLREAWVSECVFLRTEGIAGCVRGGGVDHAEVTLGVWGLF